MQTRFVSSYQHLNNFEITDSIYGNKSLCINSRKMHFLSNANADQFNPAIKVH